MNVWRNFSTAANKYSSHVAIAYGAEQYSYKQLMQSVLQLQRLVDVALQRSDKPYQCNAKIALCTAKSPLWVCGFLMTQRAGDTFVAIDSRWPKSRVSAVFTQAQPDLIISDGTFDLAEFDHTTVLTVNSTHRLSNSCETTMPPSNSDAGYLYFTSGSTGKPKGILGSSASLAHFINWQSQCLQLTPSDRVSMLTAVGFDPVLREMLLPLFNGATLVIPNAADILLDPSATLRFLQQQHISLVHQVPSLVELWLQQPEAELNTALQKVRAIMLAGEKLSASLATELYRHSSTDFALYNFYGPTETTLARFYFKVPRQSEQQLSRLGRTVPVGKPISDSDYYLLQEGKELAAKPGARGEVVIKTKYPSKGYWQAEQGKAEAFAAVPKTDYRQYATGDLGEVNDQGDLVIIGRIDRQVKINGQRVEMAEIELAYEQLPEISKAIVTQRTNEHGKVQLSLHLLTNQAVTLDYLDDSMAEQLPSYMIPSYVYCHSDFALLPNGKVDRAALAAMTPEQLPSTGVGYLARQQGRGTWPNTPVAQQLQQIWLELFQQRTFYCNHSAFSLGASSLQIVALLAAVKQQLNVAIPYFEFAQYATPIQLLKLYQQYQAHPVVAAAVEKDKGSHQLSIAEQGLVFTQQLYPQLPLYNMPYQMLLSGSAVKPRMSAAVAKLSHYHKLNKAIDLDNLTWRDGASEPLLSWHDCTTAAQAQRYAKQWASDIFALEQGPLLRVLVVQMEHQWLLAMCAHHLLFDAEQFALVFDNLLSLYHNAPLSSPRAVPDNRTMLASYDQAQQYWQQRLVNRNTELDLTGNQHAKAEAFSGGLLRFSLDGELTAALRGLAKEAGVSLNSMLFSAFQLLLFKYSEQPEIITGMPVKLSAANAAGFHINPLPIVTQFAPEQSWQALVAEVSKQIQQAIQHANYPFAEMVNDLKLQGTLGYHPIFQSLFAFHDSQLQLQFSQQGLERIDCGVARYSLSLDMWLAEDQLQGLFEYGACAFDPHLAKALIPHFTTLLQSMVQQPQSTLANLSLLPSQEVQQIQAFATTPGEYPAIDTIDAMIAAQVQQTPEHIAVCYQDKQLSYQQLQQWATQWAEQLYALGVRPGDRLGLSISRSLQLVVGFYASLKLGAVYVPLDPDYPANRRAFVIADTEMQFILCEEALASHYAEHNVSRLVVDGLADIKALDQRPNTANDMAYGQHGGQDVAYIIYTSGSSGKPKGVEVPHRGVCNLAYGEVAFLDMQPGSRVLQFASFSFDTSIWEIVMTLCSGGALVMADKLDLLPGPDLANTLQQQQISHVTLPASSLAALPYQDFPELKVIITAGEACALDLVRLWGKGRRFINSYGPTEASVSATNAELNWDCEQVHIGKPLPNVHTWVLDQQRQLRPLGLPGELYIGGIGLAKGYLKRPQLSAEKFVSDPFSSDPQARLYRTGDLVRLGASGELEFLGRIDEQVKVRGYRIEPSEIEAVLRQSEQVIDAKVVLKQQQGVPLLVAYVSTTTATFQEQQLRAYVAEHLPNYMQLDRFVALSDFPRLPNNKINIKALPELPEPQSSATTEGQLTATEQLVATAWQQCLATTVANNSDNFFSLGGNSLVAVSMMRQLSKRFALDLGVSELFRCPTVAALATYIESNQQQTEEVTQPTRVSSETWYPMTSAQQRLFYLQQMEPQSCSYNLTFCDTLSAELDPDLLVEALRLALLEHAGMRCVFRHGEAGLQQKISGEVSELVQLHYCQGGEQSVAAQCQTEVTAAQSRVWSLSQGVALTITVLSDGQACHAIILACHHILLDQEAFTRFRHSWQQRYQQLASHSAEAQSVVVDQQIIHHALWQQQLSHSAKWQDDLRYWQQQLQDANTQLNLPIQAQGDGQQQLEVIKEAITPALVTQLQQLAKQQQCSEFTCWLGLFYGFLYRYCAAQQDLTLLLPVLGLSKQEDYVGLRLNTLALRQQLQQQQTLEQVIQQTHKQFLDATQHGQVPYEKVVEHLGWSGGGAPQVMFVYKQQQATSTFLGASCQHQAYDAQQVKFPLSLFVNGGGDDSTAELVWEFDRSRITLQQVQQLNQAWLFFLAQALAAPSAKLATLTVQQATPLTPAPVPTEQGLSLAQQLKLMARKQPQELALSQGGHNLSYAEADELSDRLAAWLSEQLGAHSQPRCLVLQQHSPMLVISIIAAVKAGVCYIPVDRDYPLARIQHIVADAEPDVILTDLASQQLSQQLQEGATKTMSLVVDSSTSPWRHYEAEYQTLTHCDTAYIIYTSGSTGKPKGVAITLASLQYYLRQAITTYLPEQRQGGMILHSSVGFDATITSLFLPWLTARPLYIVDPDNSLESLCQLWAERHYDAVKIAPAHLEVLRQHIAPEALGNVSNLIIGGDALYYEALAPWQQTQTQVFNEYGPTEATVGCAVYAFKPCQHLGSGAVPIGKAMAGSQLLLLDNDHHPVPRGVTAELFIAGEGLATHYVNLPELTAERFIHHGDKGELRLYCSGDLVRQNDAGELIYVGRKDNQVKLAGHRIELAEIASCALQLNTINEALATVVDSTTERPQLALFYVADDDAEAALQQHLQQQLPHYMQPRHYQRLAAMPLTHNGKVDRNALIVSPRQAKRSAEMANDKTTATLKTIWQQVLGLDEISSEANFFALGGDSILSLQVIYKAREAGLTLTPKMLLRYQTIAELAQQIRQQTQPQYQGHVGDCELAPIMHWALRYNQNNHNHLNQSRVFQLEANCDLTRLQQAVLSVSNHHDMLRFRLRRVAQQWQAEIAPPLRELALEPVATLEPHQLDDWILQQQSGLDLATSGVQKLALFQLPGQALQLLWVMHHSAIDALSWQILLADVTRAYRQLMQGNTPKLPRTSQNYAVWATWCQNHSEADFSALAPSSIAALPLYDEVDNEPWSNAQQCVQVQHLKVQLDQAIPFAAAHLNKQQLILTASLAQAIRAWAGFEQVWIVNESHGRDVDGIDISRTLGWFTHFIPLKINTSAQPLGTLRAAALQLTQSQQLSRVDRRLDSDLLQQCHVCLNFLGKLDETHSDSVLQSQPTLALQHQSSALNQRGFILTVDVITTEQGLSLYWSHAHKNASVARLQALQQQFEHCLNDCLAQLQQARAQAYLDQCHPALAVDLEQFEQLQRSPQVTQLLPASELQQAMIHQSQHNPAAAFYHEQLCFDLPQAEPEQQAHYRACWQQLVAAHPMLRARVVYAGDEEPVIAIDKHISVVWQALKITTQSQWQALLEADSQQGFELDNGPLHRVYWVEYRQQIKLLLVHHHCILDGWSVSLLLQQFTDLLRGEPLTEQPYQLVPNAPCEALAVPFWQQQLATWQPQALALDTLSALQLASNVDRQLVSRTLVVSQPQSRALEALAKAANVSLNTLLQGAWAIVLQRQCGLQSLCFGVTHAGRQPQRGELQHAIGLFIETLPLVVAYTPEATIAQWLQQLQQTMAQVQQHACGLTQLRQIAKLPPSARLFDTLVVFENYPQAAQPSHFVFDFAHEKTEIPLTLVVSDGAELTIKFNYLSPDGQGQQLQALVAQLDTALAHLAQASSQLPLGQITTTSKAQQHWLQARAQGSKAELEDADLLSQFDTMVARYPNQCAVASSEAQLSYAQLAEQSCHLGAVLWQQGVRPGDYVGVSYDAEVELVVAIFAILRLGAGYIAIDSSYPQARKQYMLEQAQARLVLTSECHTWQAYPAIRALSVAQLLTQTASQPASWPRITAASPCYVIYTSGSTGQPKGVAISHGALSNYLCHSQRRYHYPVGGIVPVTTSISFDATITSLLVPLSCGAQVELIPREQQLPRLAAGIKTGRYCLAKITPAHLDLLRQALAPDFQANIPMLIVGGEALHQASCAPWLAQQVRIINEYGPTEATVGCSTFEVTMEMTSGDVAIGQPIQNSEIYVLAEDASIQPVGAIGELYIGGQGLADGYLGQPELTAERFISHPFKPAARLYKSGDFGYVDNAGLLHYCGRRDGQIKLRGHRIELSEIEQQLLCEPAVEQVAVAPYSNPQHSAGRVQLIAFVVTRQSSWPHLQTQLQQRAEQHLPEYMRPDAYQCCAVLPLSHNGKLDRDALIATYTPPETRFLAPETDTEKRLASIWQEQLQVPKVGQQCSFFELGGHSLKASQILARVQREFRVKVPLAAFLRTPTLGALAGEIDKSAQSQTKGIQVSARRKR